MQYGQVQSKITYLKMKEKPAYFLPERMDIKIKQLDKPISVEMYRALYKSVGEELNWLDRIFMDDSVLRTLINNENTFIYHFLMEENIAGYCELVIESTHVEILYFGLISDYVGKGYGKYLLNKTIELAWSFNPDCIQLNTCDLDHPNALPTYLKAGFVAYDEMVETKKIILRD